MFVCVGRWQRSNVACQADKEKAKIRAIEQISADITFVVYTAKVFFDRNKTSNCCVYSNSFEASRQNSVVFHSTHYSLLLLFIFLPFFFSGHLVDSDYKEFKQNGGGKKLKLFPCRRKQMATNWLPFWMLILSWCCHLLPGDTFRAFVLAENVRLDLTTANGYQWQTSLPNGSKSRGYVSIIK